MIDAWPDACGSVGYQGRSIGDLCDALVDSGVELLLDVRAIAWSARPEFRKSALADALRAGGVEYVHFKVAGNPFRPRRGEKVSVQQCASKFRAHLQDRPDILEQLNSVARGKRVALFCYEARTHECHRGVILEQANDAWAGLVVEEL